MHKQFWNSLQLDFRLDPVSPILIRAGGISLNPALPDMQFVRTFAGGKETVFIPGSSLKGVFRSFSEKVLRTTKAELACEPFPSEKAYCGRKLESEDDTAAIYKNSCRACRIYGNTRLRGRLSFTDLYPQGETRTETRYGVAISRLSHAVAVGPFDLEVLVSGQFQGTLVLENFEVWQLGLLALTVQAVNDGIVKIGYGKNRGLGQVKIEVQRVAFAQAKKDGIPANEWWGVGRLVDASERQRYGLKEGDRLTGLPQPLQTTDLVVLVQRTYGAEQWAQIEQASTATLALLTEANS